jgi:hypothetical protein
MLIFAVAWGLTLILSLGDFHRFHFRSLYALAQATLPAALIGLGITLPDRPLPRRRGLLLAGLAAATALHAGLDVTLYDRAPVAWMAFFEASVVYLAAAALLACLLLVRWYRRTDTDGRTPGRSIVRGEEYPTIRPGQYVVVIDGEGTHISTCQARVDGAPGLAVVRGAEYPAARRSGEKITVVLDSERRDVHIRQARIDGNPGFAVVRGAKYPPAIRSGKKVIVLIGGKGGYVTSKRPIGLLPEVGLGHGRTRDKDHED